MKITDLRYLLSTRPRAVHAILSKNEQGEWTADGKVLNIEEPVSVIVFEKRNHAIREKELNPSSVVGSFIEEEIYLTDASFNPLDGITTFPSFVSGWDSRRTDEEFETPVPAYTFSICDWALDPPWKTFLRLITRLDF